MDTFYRGLVAPQRSFSLGRADIAEGERPGAILAAMAIDALRAGDFEPRRQAIPDAGARAVAHAPSYVERQDYGAFDDEPEETVLGH